MDITQTSLENIVKLKNAFDQDVNKDLNAIKNNNFDIGTYNSRYFLEWDFHFDDISKVSNDIGFLPINLNRGIWNLIATINPETRELFLFMKEKNINSILKNNKKENHYLNILLQKNEQLSVPLLNDTDFTDKIRNIMGDYSKKFDKVLIFSKHNLGFMNESTLQYYSSEGILIKSENIPSIIPDNTSNTIKLTKNSENHFEVKAKIHIKKDIKKKD
ncbi:DUF5986 family protein [Apilactobacillus quenuiae]|uniref:DUF5986 family protein n=1 Tax=Apilactobacillus quenuiae TaxID=2008377 RepID=UPI000D02044B|nr:DUF5986 family protein [Apilactobacillus quenuiae]